MRSETDLHKSRPGSSLHTLTLPERFLQTSELRTSLVAAAVLLLAGFAQLVLHFESIIFVVVLLVAPGLALSPYLPNPLREPPISWLLAPLLGCATASITLTTIAAAQIPITEASIYLALGLLCIGALVGASFLAPMPVAELTLWQRLKASPEVPLFLLAILLIGVALQARVLAGTPPPGADWGHYLTYSSQISSEHRLVLDNHLWMFGHNPFPEDPGAPTLYALFLLVSGKGPYLLYHGIWVFAVFTLLSLFASARALAGNVAGLVATGIYATAPLALNIFAWHGLANVYALAFFPLALASLVWIARGDASWRWCSFLAFNLVAVAAAHRLSVVLLAITVGLVLALLALRDRRVAMRACLVTGAFAVLIGWGVFAYLVEQKVALGPLQPYEAYLSTKIDGYTLRLVRSDLTWPLLIAGGVALLLLARRWRIRRDGLELVLLAFMATLVGFSLTWVVHFPTEYVRAIYYLPLLFALAVGCAIATLPKRAAYPVATGLVLWLALLAHPRLGEVRDFYTVVDRGSERGLQLVARRLDPGEPIVADRCWAFISPWSLRHRTLGGLNRSDLLPRSEAQPAAVARRILRGDSRLARRYGVRFGLIDPLCVHKGGDFARVPTSGTPIFESFRLVVIRF
jgi:hypothetical protein